MIHSKYLGMKLTEAEESALLLWAEHEGIDNKSTMMRRVFNQALRNMAPRSIFPAQLTQALNIRPQVES